MAAKPRWKPSQFSFSSLVFVLGATETDGAGAGDVDTNGRPRRSGRTRQELLSQDRECSQNLKEDRVLGQVQTTSGSAKVVSLSRDLRALLEIAKEGGYASAASPKRGRDARGTA
ncbi:hypothetical protein C8F01DRAFT_1186305 [Mycena amicta]|nr:hypothetical protein C8F01DRAFT_1186305 [Mycena amicta]